MNAITTAKRTEIHADPFLMWADATTNADSPRRHDLIRDKSTAVKDFFSFVGVQPGVVTAEAVKEWQSELTAAGLKPATVYAKISRVSSFYNWLLKDDNKALAQRLGITGNPVNLARPKAPKAYQNERSRALDDEDVLSLLRTVKGRADTGSIVAKRDYALLLFYFLTGMRRREVMQLRWGDIKLNGTVKLHTQFKNGNYETREIADPSVRDALVEYLTASGRMENMEADTPLWVQHDRNGQWKREGLSSHGFVKNVKKYAAEAGLGDFHLHQTRHTFARMVAEDTGSITDVQDALGHANAATTKVYVKRIATKKDKHSGKIAQRLML